MELNHAIAKPNVCTHLIEAELERRIRLQRRVQCRRFGSTNNSSEFKGLRKGLLKSRLLVDFDADLSDHAAADRPSDPSGERGRIF